MAANNIANIFLLAFLFLISSVHADSDMGDNSKAIIDYAKREVMIKSSELGVRIALCDQQRNSVAIPDIKYEELKKMGASRQQIIKALSHLSTRNYATCEGGAREALAYALGTLSTLANQYKVEIESIQGIEENLIYPTSRDIELALEFSNLKDEVKQQLLGAVGDQPFNLMETLRKNRLNAD
ncbi:MAG: hypothetical protein KZQ93_18125 [Candidatus Thiodiazotropha sp. (ex Monitilora ramsayi)]|nr:hypothetical protein [Candidatus Thiodiazotropha sp. (ex Monitilora ramsayi)]